MAHGDIMHLEIPLKDFAGGRAFYSAVFGWQPAAVPGFDDYEMFQCPNGEAGGALTPREEGFTQPRSFVEVDSIDAAIAAATGAGGAVVAPKANITETSWWAVVADPEGNQVGLFEGVVQMDAE